MKSQGERISSLETIYTEILKPIPSDLKEIKETVQRIDLKMEETNRRVLEHHSFLKELKISGCPRPKNNPGPNREHNERKKDAPRYKYIFWSAIATGTAGIISTILLLIFK